MTQLNAQQATLVTQQGDLATVGAFVAGDSASNPQAAAGATPARRIRTMSLESTVVGCPSGAPKKMRSVKRKGAPKKMPGIRQAPQLALLDSDRLVDASSDEGAPEKMRGVKRKGAANATRYVEKIKSRISSRRGARYMDGTPQRFHRLKKFQKVLRRVSKSRDSMRQVSESQGLDGQEQSDLRRRFLPHPHGMRKVSKHALSIYKAAVLQAALKRRRSTISA